MTTGAVRDEEGHAYRAAGGRGVRGLARLFALALAFVAPAAFAAPTTPGDTVRPPSAVEAASRSPSALDASIPLTGWSVGGDEDHTVVTFDLGRRVPVRVFTLAGPTRVVIDLSGGRFEAEKTRAGEGRGLVAGWRFGALSAGRSRLVIETRGPALPARVAWDPSAPADRARFVLELNPASAADMARAEPRALSPEPSETATATPAGKQDRERRAVEPPPQAVPRPVIVVDAGHGGIDAGTVSPATGTPEKTVVLDMARVLARRLSESGRYSVHLTRGEDVFLGLGERVKIARALKADLFVSIHADAEYDHSVRGATIYTLAEKPSDEQAAALAAKENQSDALAGHVVEEADGEVADILADLTLRETRRLSHALARDLLDEYRRHGRLVKTQPHRQAGLKVLRAHDIPSVLVEIGFLSNKEDEALMTSSDWREKTAGSLVSAIDRWFAGRDALASPRKVGDGRAAASP